MNPKTHYSAAEIAHLRLKSLPHTVQGVSYQAKKGNWEAQKRAGRGGGKEYAFAGLPAEVQAEITRKLTAEQVAPLAKKITHDRDTALAMRDTSRLSSKQRNQADARAALAAYVHEIEASGLSRKAAIAEVSRQSQAGELPDALAEMALLAPAKRRKALGFGERSLHSWVLECERASNPTERLAALAPRRMGTAPLDLRTLAWMPEFMAVWRNKNGLPIAEAHRSLVKTWGAKYGNLDGCPTLGQVERALSRIPGHIKELGRKTGAEMRALRTYVKRDWSTMQANDCWVGDGHSMKMKVRHPDHGQPFTPELTLIIDAPSRYIVGWSVSYSESTIAVADALRYAMERHGIPALYYSDNGGGQKNKALDADVTGILPRLGIRHETGIPGNPQGRGIIERVNKTIALPIARYFATYYGDGADASTVRDVLTGVKSLAKAEAEGKTATLTPKQRGARGKLPSWQDLLVAVEAGITEYNENHKHSELNGATPAQMRSYLLGQADADSIVKITEAESRDLFRPEFIRRVQRGWLSHHNNDYWHRELENHDGRDVIVGVDIHDASTVIVREAETGKWLCDAVWNGNKRAAFAETIVDKARQDRAKAALKRIEDKQAMVAAELRPAIEQQAAEMIVLPPARVAAPEKVYDFLGQGIKKAK